MLIFVKNQHELSLIFCVGGLIAAFEYLDDEPLVPVAIIVWSDSGLKRVL